MGQRSQIFVRFENYDKKKELAARYYQWNYRRLSGKAASL